MTDQSLTEPVLKRADQIVVGDRIPDEHLAFRFNQGPAEVVFVAHEHTATLPWIFAAYRYPNGQHDSMTIRPEAMLQVYPAPDVETTQPIAGRAPQPIARHYDASDEWTNECACGESFDTVGQLNGHIEAANAVPLVNEGGHTAVAVGGGLIEIDPPEGFFIVPHGPVKPPYGSPEREAYDREHKAD